MRELTALDPELDGHDALPIVSIITPTFNSADYISETIASVAQQEYQRWEHIIVDDASSDNTSHIVKDAMRRDDRIKFIELDINSGAAVARNTAIDVAVGRFIAFLDADDLWMPQKLSKQIEYMLRTGAPFTFASYEIIDSDGKQIGAVDVPDAATYSSILRNNVIGCLTAVYDVQQLGKVRMPLIRKRQDLGLWLRILKLTPFAMGISDPLARYRVRPGSISESRLDAARYTWRLYRDIEHLPLICAIYSFAYYVATRAIKRYKLARKSGTW